MSSPSPFSSTALLTSFSFIAPHTPTPIVQQIVNYALADPNNLYKKYEHKCKKHILL